jgi:predicted amidohydrolase YtcJ
LKHGWNKAARMGMIGALAMSQGAALAQPASGAPDLVLMNGKVITVDRGDSVAQAIAIKDGKILAVGSNAQITRMASGATKRVDLGGRTVTPGLIDTHAHLVSGGVGERYSIILGSDAVKSIADVKRLVAAKVAAAKPGEWITGSGWDEGKLAEKRYIHAADLDEVAPNNPVVLTHTTGHYAVANSAALKIGGVTRDTQAPPGGTIDKNPDGSLTGVLKEGAMGLVRSHVPDTTDEQTREGLLTSAQTFVSECVTAVKDPIVSTQSWNAYKQVQSEGRLPLRIFGLWGNPRTDEDARALISRIGPTTKPYQTTGDDQLISGGVKMFIDGSGGARTAWMHDDWHKDFTGVDTGNKGYPMVEPAAAFARLKMYHDAGIHVGAHAIGDRAIDWLVDSYKTVQEANPKPGIRHSIIHGNTPTPHAVAVMADLQKRYDTGYPEAQAPFMWYLGDTYAANLGPERAPNLKPFKAFLDKGVIWAGGSDYPVTPIPARYGLWASVERATMLGTWGKTPFGMGNSVDVHVALRSYTDWASRQLFLEKKVGTIEPGKYADLAVWDKDVYAIPTDTLKDLKCEMTFMGGKPVYRAPTAPQI